MPVPIPTSVGYEGTVNEAQWSALMAEAGSRRYGVLDAASWKVTAGSADREVRIAPGSGFGHGVLDTSTASASISLPAVASGSRWHLVVVRRNWAANQSAFDSVAGPTDAAAIPTRETSPGVLDDQPIALVRVQAGQSQVVEIRDLRVWGGEGGAFAIDDLVRQYINRIGTAIFIDGVVWNRTTDALGSPRWVRSPVKRQGGSAEGVNGGAIVAPNGYAPLVGITIAEPVAAGSLLHIRADVEIYVGGGDDYAGYLQIWRGQSPLGVLLGIRRWHTHSRANRWLNPTIELNLAITEDLPANTVLQFGTTSDPLSAGGIEVWMANASWSVS